MHSIPRREPGNENDTAYLNLTRSQAPAWERTGVAAPAAPLAKHRES